MALVAGPVCMGSRVNRTSLLDDARSAIGIFVALIGAVGCSPKELEDVLNNEDEGGPARMERAYSLFERCKDGDGPERQQALESILFPSAGDDDDNSETDYGDEDEDEDEIDADDEQDFDDSEEAPATVSMAASSTQGGEEVAVVQVGVGLEPASQASQGSEDSLFNYEEEIYSGDETEVPQCDDEALLNYPEEVVVSESVALAADLEEEELDEWAREEEEEDREEDWEEQEDGDPSASDEATQATQEADHSDQEGAASPARMCGVPRDDAACVTRPAVGGKRRAAAADCAPLLPKRPRHDASTASTISTTSTVVKEAAVLEEAPLMAMAEAEGSPEVEIQGAEVEEEPP